MLSTIARIEVTFQVDADGILAVSAVEQQTGARSEIVVKPAFGLGEAQITDMLKAGYEHASEDMLARQLGEARVEAEALLDGLLAAMTADGDLLSADEAAALQSDMKDLETVMAANQPDDIREATETLGKASEVLPRAAWIAAFKKRFRASHSRSLSPMSQRNPHRDRNRLTTPSRDLP